MFSEEGVTEMFKNNEVKLYSSSDTSCNCIYHKENLVPCFHILYYREKKELRMFDADTFDKRYRRNFNIEVSEDLLAETSVDNQEHEESPGEEESESVSFTDREKY